MQDALLAVVQVLAADAGVRAVFADPVDLARVWGIELPESQAAGMPRKQVVVRRASGTGGAGGNVPLETGVLDVACYGETPLEAERLRGACRDALRACTRVVKAGTLLHNLEPSGAPTTLRDPNVQWPIVIEPWRFLASETLAA